MGAWGNHTKESGIKVGSDNTISGYRVSNEWAQNQKIYFYAEFSAPIKSVAIFKEKQRISFIYDVMSEGSIANGANGADLNFGRDIDEIIVKVSISPVSIENAKKNLKHESASTDTFSLMVNKAKLLWSDALDNIDIKGGTLEQKKIFFTSYYHTLLAPFVFQDVNGEFRKMSSVIETSDSNLGELGEDKPDYMMNASEVRHNKSKFTNYSIYSMWDTFRAAHPLKTIINKQRAIDFVYDLLNKYQTGGLLPKWELHSDYTGEMDGYPAVAIIADTMVKFPGSFSDDDFKLALEASLVSSNFDESIGLNMGWKPYVDAWNGDKRWITMTKHSSLQEKYGFIPADAKLDDEAYMSIVNESVSYGLEDSYYDWCIAQIASVAMRQHILKESDLIQTVNRQAANQTVGEIKSRYLQRSQSFKQYFDYNPSYYANYAGKTGYSPTGFMRPLLKNGEFLHNAIKDDSVFGYSSDCLRENDQYSDKIACTEFWPYRADHRGEDYTEGNPWQWTWFVPHDVQGLSDLMDGVNNKNHYPLTEHALRKNLDAFFSANSDEGNQEGDMTGYIGQYVHGNEPDHHVVYLYNYTDTPWKTQKYVDEILTRFYSVKKNGIIGNEDVGQMSAWYMMSAMGFYQITPGKPEYTIGRPLFDSVTISLEDGDFKIIVDNNSVQNIYVKNVTINGKPLGKYRTFTQDQIKAGGELRFEMTHQQPN